MNHSYDSLRLEYEALGLHEEDIHKSPFLQFRHWFQAALDLKIDLANAMVLATANKNGMPDARYVLLKDYSERGFVFYTSSLSRKGRQLADNPYATLVFYWREMHRQIRVEGSVEQLPEDTSDSYFQTRPRGSQISAWVASQSEVIPDREYLKDREAALLRQYAGLPVPRPDNWTGYCVKPERIEFWQGQENRLHDRIQYQLTDTSEWSISRLAP
jgi:pyridoxamine 5'-phosphate oxidase